MYGICFRWIFYVVERKKILYIWMPEMPEISYLSTTNQIFIIIGSLKTAKKGRNLHEIFNSLLF